jgi:hypothetical protein
MRVRELFELLEGQKAAPQRVTAKALDAALAHSLAPTAGPPPVITPQLWAETCKGAEHRRCGRCDLCAWEREAERWAAVSPWTKRHALARPAGAPLWPSLAAALIALVDWEAHDRCGPSAMGPMLDRVRAGDISGDGGRSRPEDPLLQRAGDLVAVRQALEHAFPEGGHVLPVRVRMRLLLERTPGVLQRVPTYEELAAREGVAAGDIRALVRTGRERVAMELIERGLIPAAAVARLSRRNASGGK